MTQRGATKAESPKINFSAQPAEPEPVSTGVGIE